MTREWEDISSILRYCGSGGASTPSFGQPEYSRGTDGDGDAGTVVWDRSVNPEQGAAADMGEVEEETGAGVESDAARIRSDPWIPGLAGIAKENDPE